MNACLSLHCGGGKWTHRLTATIRQCLFIRLMVLFVDRSNKQKEFYGQGCIISFLFVLVYNSIILCSCWSRLQAWYECTDSVEKDYQ